MKKRSFNPLFNFAIKERNLLGYDSHAAFVLEERMAKDESTVRHFLNDLRDKAYPKAEKEWEEIKAFGQQELGL